MDIRRFRGDELNLPDYKLPNSECLLYRGDELDITVNEKVNSVLGSRLFRGDELDMID